jgi:hypothetical protein
MGGDRLCFGLFQRVDHGIKMPRGYGVVYQDLVFQARWCAPLGINTIARMWMLAVWALRSGWPRRASTRFERVRQDAFNAALNANTPAGQNMYCENVTLRVALRYRDAQIKTLKARIGEIDALKFRVKMLQEQLAVAQLKAHN